LNARVPTDSVESPAHPQVRQGPQPSAGRWRTRLEVDEAESRVVAAIDEDGMVIGLATAGVTRDQDRATNWELYSINVTAQQQGSGMADDLIGLTAGDNDTTVWVRRENARAQAFYRRHGFTDDGASTVDEITGVCEIRMVRRAAKR
jgi:ribosomal protein S18 acetylase RimI-like enzyme